MQDLPALRTVWRLHEAQHADAGPTCSTNSMNKRGKRGKRPSHIQRGDSEETPCVCRACDGFHLTRRCLYLFPDSRPTSWKPNKQIQRIVDKNLKRDSALAEEVERWTKEKDGGKLQMRNVWVSGISYLHREAVGSRSIHRGHIPLKNRPFSILGQQFTYSSKSPDSSTPESERQILEISSGRASTKSLFKLSRLQHRGHKDQDPSVIWRRSLSKFRQKSYVSSTKEAYGGTIDWDLITYNKATTPWLLSYDHFVLISKNLPKGALHATTLGSKDDQPLAALWNGFHLGHQDA